MFYHIRQNFRGGKLSRLCTKHTIHWKTFTVHQPHAIMYCTRQVIQGENFRDWLKNRESHESFPHKSFAVYGIRVNVTALLEYINLFIKVGFFSQKPVRSLPFRPYHFLRHCNIYDLCVYLCIYVHPEGI